MKSVPQKMFLWEGSLDVSKFLAKKKRPIKKLYHYSNRYTKNSSSNKFERFVKSFNKNPNQLLQVDINKKMPTQLEATAGIQFNFNILTYARSKNITIIRRFYIKVNLLQPNKQLSCISSILYLNFLHYRLCCSTSSKNCCYDYDALYEPTREELHN